MADPYLGEIRLMAFQFAPHGWALCNGQVLAINQNQALFALLGTTYGGNGVQNFQLPNLQGRVPVHFGQGLAGQNIVWGESGGETTHVLTSSEMPGHSHTAMAADLPGNVPFPELNSWGRQTTAHAYAASGSLVQMASNAVLIDGSNEAHNNMPPYLVINFCIALQGIFPSRN